LRYTKEEDEKLASAIEKCGVGKWAKVAEYLYPRTDNQCWRRWKKLNSDIYPEYQQKVIKKRMLVRNFVGREKERPDLTSEDIYIDPEEILKHEEKTKSLRKKIHATPVAETDDTPTVTFSIQSSNNNVSSSTGNPLTFEDSSVPSPMDLPDSNMPNNKDSVEQLSLPLVLPSPATFKSLNDLLSSLDETHIEENDMPPNLIESPEFKLLSAWFNSLFMFPTIILQELDLVKKGETPENTDQNKSKENNENNQNTN